MSVFLGLDCGGSHCRALACDEKGVTVFSGQSGPGNLASTPTPVLTKNLQRATSGSPQPEFVCGCFAGLLTDEDRRQAQAVLKSIFPKSKISVYPDYAAAHMSAEDGTDFTLIAGTGSIICSRKGDQFVKSGGRGYLIGDFGSAFRYGREALRDRLDSKRFKDEETANALIEETFGSGNEQEILASLYRSRTPAALLARLLPLFVDDLKKGEPYAGRFLEDESERLANVVSTHIARYLADQHSVQGSLAGGVWNASGQFKASLETQLSAAMPEVEIKLAKIKQPPVRGALNLAKMMKDEH